MISSLISSPSSFLSTKQATALTAQSYRKVVTTARRDKKAGNGPKGLTEEQKQEIRCVQSHQGPHSGHARRVYIYIYAH